MTCEVKQVGEPASCDCHGSGKPQLGGRFGNESIAAGQALGEDDDAIAYFLHLALGAESVAGEGHRLKTQV
jgi:hypothetical protein